MRRLQQAQKKADEMAAKVKAGAKFEDAGEAVLRRTDGGAGRRPG